MRSGDMTLLAIAPAVLALCLFALTLRLRPPTAR
jgi:hypothetical protein